MFLLKKLLTSLILPPTGPVLLALFGLWLAGRKSRRWQHAGRWLAGLSLLALLVLSLPITGNALLRSLEIHPPVTDAKLRDIQAIVILGGGSYHQAPEYGGDTVHRTTLERLRYGAHLARETGKPLLVTGGAPFGGRPEGESMKEALERDFAVPVRWAENASRDTGENAAFSAPLLKSAGITRIALVSHGWHLRRAVPLFEREGLSILPAPTAFSTGSPSIAQEFLPSSLQRSRSALHEYLGIFYNHLFGAP